MSDDPAGAPSGDPYDDDVRGYVAGLLYAALPALYRVRDEPPAGHGDLAAFLDILAAPLAVLRRSVEDLHADLFVDTAADEVIPYLAEMVGTTLVFPDADANRLDVRGTVGWRRRKGTPGSLREMAEELAGGATVLQEGWRMVQLAQDLNLARPQRVAPDLRPAVVAEQATGPLDEMSHAVDIGATSATTGRYHPHDLTFWLHPTQMFPLAAAVPATVAGGPDARFALDPLGGRRPARARRTGDATAPFTDRVPEQHFAADPGGWFGQPGGFTIRECAPRVPRRRRPPGVPAGCGSWPGHGRRPRCGDRRTASRRHRRARRAGWPGPAAPPPNARRESRAARPDRGPRPPSAPPGRPELPVRG